jgi:hypothetical protein
MHVKPACAFHDNTRQLRCRQNGTCTYEVAGATCASARGEPLAHVDSLSLRAAESAPFRASALEEVQGSCKTGL